jgi:hydrogenase/urease accessory protein HupE
MSWRALLTAAIVLGLAGAASAHALAPSLLELRELASGRVALRWKTPLVQPTGSELRPRPPAHCVEAGEPRLRVERAAAVEHRELDCGARGLEGATLGVDGLVRGGPNALVRATLRDGRIASAALHAGAPRFVVPARQAPAHVALGYLRLGLEHILLGLDHLLLVLGLVLLAPGRRALLCTISCFTAGHSVTLALATLGFVRLPAGPIEIAIAATLFWLGLELARPRERRESRSPRGRSATRAALLALGFGLLHGFGFAGALAEAGLPPGEIPLALLSFNVGIELGQLAFVGFVGFVTVKLAGIARVHGGLAERALPYAIGSTAAFWILDRTAALF